MSPTPTTDTSEAENVPDRLSKQTFLVAISCPTWGWYQHRAKRGALTPGMEWQFHLGNEVGAAARRQLGPGAMLSPSPIHAQRVTREAVEDASKLLLFEATFVAGSFVARADALRRNATGWEVIEVKSGKEPDNGKIDPAYIDDLAYTVMVAREAGLNVTAASLMLLSRSYRLGAPSDPLVLIDVTPAAIARADEFAAIAPELAEMVKSDDRPEPSLKLTCRKCDYFASDCLGLGVDPTIFVLPGLSQKRLDVIKPIVALRELPDNTELTDNQRRIFDVIRSGQPQSLPGLAALDQVVWPAWYLDFETVMPSLPWFAGDGAYTNHPFQYSIHRCDALGVVTTHHEFLAPLQGDWRLEFVDQLLETLGTEGSIIVYTNFEAVVLRSMAELFPARADRIQQVIARLFDLHDVVKNGYIHPGFGGRTSIKKVLPVVAPDLSYADMTVGEGESASGVFGLMRVGRYEASQFDQWRHHLLEYCKLDTLAMVRVHAELERLRSNPVR